MTRRRWGRLVVEPIREPLADVIARVGAQARKHRSAWGLTGLRGACADCTAHGSLTVTPEGKVFAAVYHDPGCPANAGLTTWRPS